MIQFSLRKVIKPDQNSRLRSPGSQIQDSRFKSQESRFKSPDSRFQFSRSRCLEFEIFNLELSQTRQPTNAPVFNRLDVNGLLPFDKPHQTSFISKSSYVSRFLIKSAFPPSRTNTAAGSGRPL